MKKLFLKITLYLFLIIIALEIFVRAFHLHTEVPIRYIDELGVEKSLPNQTGYAVTGNRLQNFSEYHINENGFNSYRVFNPTKDKIEIAIIGDSFIEGLHQHYYNSIGKKIEIKLKNVEVYEYGYAGYNLSNQLYLINKYKKDFDLIDHIVVYLKYENDLQYGIYTPNTERITLLSSTVFKIRDKFKLLSYASATGVLDPMQNFVLKLMNRNKKEVKKSNKEIAVEKKDKDLQYLENFKSLINLYGFDKQKISFLLNSNTTSDTFLKYCNENRFQIIDFYDAFKNTKKSTTLIYDMHWNNYGRELIANTITQYYSTKLPL